MNRRYHSGMDSCFGSGIGVQVMYERPGKIRRLLRRIKLDRTEWEYRVKHRHISPSQFFKESK